MSDRRELIEASLAAAADRIGDPTALVYERLFATEPEVAAMFAFDKSGAVKGEMLARAFDTILDFAGDQVFAANFLRAEQGTMPAMASSRRCSCGFSR